MKTAATILASAGLIATVSAHGLLVTPTPRQPGGTAHKAACGQQASYIDKNGNVQGILQVVRQQSDFKAADCNVWLCKGYQFADNTANVQKYSVGQVVPITFNIAAPHTGVANVSIVDTTTNTVIGSPLKSYSDFASNQHQSAADEKQFSITIPDLGGKCATAGECVIQHFWDARNIDQTYESCIDFTVGGGSGGSSPAPAPSSAAPAPSSSAPAQSSSTLVTVTKVAEPTVATTSAAAPTASAPSSGSTKPLPEGTTLADILAWIKILLNQ
ncbi:Hypothetical protein D9617_2g057000 [Elsinoe fawcettii]|nr:Hypothetical protein D9617_2g057000 [Elsinoe fawcettii]